MLRVLFVCTGNTCRSPMAEALCRQMIQEEHREKEILALSAGLAVGGSASASREAIAVMRGWGIDISAHSSRALTHELVRAADLILTMTRRHKQAILYMSPEAAGKVFALGEFAGGEGADIADPFGADETLYRQCADEIRHHLTRTWEKIREFHKENAGENTSA